MPTSDYKRCTKCGETKPLGDFYRDRGKKDGRFSWCKACAYAQSRAWKAANPGRVAANAKRGRERHPQREAEWHKRWAEQNPGARASAVKRHRQRHPEKAKARIALGNAVRDGVVTKPDHCQDCGGPAEPGELHGHHDDYSKPLEVEWLCRACHHKRHSA